MILKQEYFLNPKKEQGYDSIYTIRTHDKDDENKESEFWENKKTYWTNESGKKEWGIRIDETIGIKCTKEGIEILQNNEYIRENFEMDITKYADDYYSVYFDKKQPGYKLKELYLSSLHHENNPFRCKEFCLESGCDYYYGDMDECMFGEDEIPTNLTRQCIEDNK